MRPILLVPGLYNSGPSHWQSYWEEELDQVRRADLPDWDTPRPEAWIPALDREIARCAAPPILVGHSLGALTIAHWAAAHDRPVRGALLVAPCNPTQPDTRPELRPFAPVPRRPLPFPSLVVASSDDPFATLRWARELAADWQSTFMDIGACGHINAASGHGRWPEGQALLLRF